MIHLWIRYTSLCRTHTDVQMVPCGVLYREVPLVPLDHSLAFPISYSQIHSWNRMGRWDLPVSLRVNTLDKGLKSCVHLQLYMLAGFSESWWSSLINRNLALFNIAWSILYCLGLQRHLCCMMSTIIIKVHDCQCIAFDRIRCYCRESTYHHSVVYTSKWQFVLVNSEVNSPYLECNPPSFH